MNFVKFRWLYFAISLVLLVSSIFSLANWGLRPAIDFTGGSILEIKFEKQEVQEQIKKIVQENQDIELSSLQKSDDNTYLIRMKTINKDQKNKLIKNFEEQIGQNEEIRFITVGPSIGKELIRKTVFAVIMAAGFIMLYVALRFKDKKFGVCAILAMFHDSLILIGTFAFMGYFFGVEVDTLFVTAVLTTLSLSVHDTVVVYDRVREAKKLFARANLKELVNKAIAETLNRSIINSLTIIFMLLSLWLFGGETIQWFVFALLVGTILGTYSSTFIAAPLLVLWEDVKKKSK